MSKAGNLISEEGGVLGLEKRNGCMAEEPASSKSFFAVYMSEWVFVLLRCPSSSCFKGCQGSGVPHCPCTGLISKAEHHDANRSGIFRETVTSGSSLVSVFT